VKKTIMIAVSVAALLTALTVFVCDDPKVFDNPLDKDGDNYLFGDTTDEKGKLETGGNGQANLFDSSKYEQCDPVNPTLTLKSTSPVTLTTVDVVKFNELMNINQAPGWFDSLITYTKGKNGTADVKPVPPCVSVRSANKYGDCMEWSARDKTPDPGEYRIWYRVEKKECNKKVPYDEKDRLLTVKLYEAPDSGTPVIALLGEKNVDIKEGAAAYSDRGVVVTLNGANNMNLLDSVVVRGSGNYYLKVDSKPISFTDVKLPNNPTVGSTYTITYYASYKSPSGNYPTTNATEVRNVSVTADNAKLPAVIVLKPYRHKLKDGTGVDAPDTMLPAGKTDNDYIEKGVEKVYWLNGTTEVALQTGSVKITKASPFITNQSFSAAGREVSYSIDPGSGYDGVTVKRRVFLTSNECEEGPIAPNITFRGSDTIPANTPWSYSDSWSVENRQDTDFIGRTGIKYFIHFNGLDPNKPVAKAGGYKITYVGLGACTGAPSAEKERIIFVK